RVPCSQLSTAFALTFRNRAKRAWLAFRDFLIRRISRGQKLRGGGGSSVTLRSPRSPFSYRSASFRAASSSANTLIFFFVLAISDSLGFLDFANHLSYADALC